VAQGFLDDLFGLDGRIALVTGASSGLGRHFAATLARVGARVGVAARRSGPLGELVSSIESAGGEAFAIDMDVMDRDSVCAGLDRLTERFGVPDIVVNNAGVGDIKRALEFTSADWDRIIGTNLTGSWIVAQESARRMVAAGIRGTIVNVTSILASRVTGGVSPYAASKAALKHLTEALALELAPTGIRVNSLAPGYIITEATREFFNGSLGQKLRDRIPTKTVGECSDLDGPLLLLCSDAGKHMTGSEVVVDAGHLCSAL
jgi:NAD(P)-dependent dehydrogenase (short-subunit alcohol dehydrogenase family)